MNRLTGVPSRGRWLAGICVAVLGVVLMTVDLFHFEKAVGLTALILFVAGMLLAVSSRYKPAFRRSTR
jgi:membrane-bound ClpP family serine protease